MNCLVIQVVENTKTTDTSRVTGDWYEICSEKKLIQFRGIFKDFKVRFLKFSLTFSAVGHSGIIA